MLSRNLVGALIAEDRYQTSKILVCPTRLGKSFLPRQPDHRFPSAIFPLRTSQTGKRQLNSNRPGPVYDFLRRAAPVAQQSYDCRLF